MVKERIFDAEIHQFVQINTTSKELSIELHLTKNLLFSLIQTKQKRLNLYRSFLKLSKYEFLKMILDSKNGRIFAKIKIKFPQIIDSRFVIK